MIRVERGAAPEFVHEEGFREARESYARYQKSGGSRVSQTRLEAARAMGQYWSLAGQYAYETFNGKCAYSEVKAEPRLHLHRPEGDTLDEKQQIWPEHYWWTAFWYRNWYLASYDVEALKRNSFPVLGPRASVPTPDTVLGDEMPEGTIDEGLLLDPCKDYPQLHLRFEASGVVRAWADRAAPWLTDADRLRGPQTIKLLELDNPRLTEARRAAVLQAASPTSVRNLGPETPHLGMLRQTVAATLVTFRRLTMTEDVRLVLPELVPHVLSDPDLASPEFVEEMRQALATTDPELTERLSTPRVEVQETAPPPPPPIELDEPTVAKPNVLTRDAAITRILIKNFQAITRYELVIPPSVTSNFDTGAVPAFSAVSAPQTPDVSEGGAASRPWRMFLGDNGSGKSSALRAIALALSWDNADEVVRASGLSWRDLLRRDTSEGRVLLEFTGAGRIDLRFNRFGPTPDGDKPTQMDCFVRGFGPTRLTTEAGPSAEDRVRVGNLLDPRQSVVHAENWLRDLHKKNRGDFNLAGITIARLLGQHELVDQKTDGIGGPDASKYLVVVRNEVRLSGEPVRTLSDGYRAIISLACDLMAGPGAGLTDMGNASGIVLVDELGSYLHPKWKAQITRNLREVFRSMQFFATTHEPLCLRGLVAREVIRVTPTEAKVASRRHAEFETVEQSPSDYRVDRLLTSPLFGLDTTIDPGVEQQFLHYYQLVRANDPADESKRKDLRSSLSRQGILGYTRRDQLIYDAIDQFLAKSPDMTLDERRAQRQKTLEYVADIWRNVADRRKGRPQP